MAKMEIDGFDDVGKYFDKLGDDLEKVDSKALKAGGEIIAKHQENFVNRSGKPHQHVRDNIKTGNIKNDGVEKYLEVGVYGWPAFKQKFLEYGTSRMPAYPFLEKGASSGENEALSAMEKVYEGAIK